MLHPTMQFADQVEEADGFRARKNVGTVPTSWLPAKDSLAFAIVVSEVGTVPNR